MGFFRQYSTMQKVRFLAASPVIFFFGAMYTIGGLMVYTSNIAGDKLAAWVRG